MFRLARLARVRVADARVEQNPPRSALMYIWKLTWHVPWSRASMSGTQSHSPGGQIGHCFLRCSRLARVSMFHASTPGRIIPL